MKTFEERYTAWLENRLSGPELEAFEKELDSRPPAESDEQEAQRLGDLLRTFGTAPALSNPDFFNHQILARIEAEQPAKASGGEASPSRGFFSWPFARFAWAGVGAAVLGWVLAKSIVPLVPYSPDAPQQTPYFAQVIETRTPDPNIYATVLHSEQDNVTVLWLDGMDYLPASYELE